MKILALFGLSALLACPTLALGQSYIAQAKAGYRSLPVVASGQMSEPDASRIHSSWPQIEQQASLFGYSLARPGWSYREVESSLLRQDVLLQFRLRQATSTGDSVFTALVSRATGRVLVVPVLYGGAVPWYSASKENYTRAIFNRVFHAAQARAALTPEGDWATLALTFAAIAGDDPLVLTEQSGNPYLASASIPTLILGSDRRYRSVELTDLRAPAGGYQVWHLRFSAFTGRLVSVQTTYRPYARVEPVAASSSPGRVLETTAEPVGRILHPAPPPAPVVLHPQSPLAQNGEALQ